MREASLVGYGMKRGRHTMLMQTPKALLHIEWLEFGTLDISLTEPVEVTYRGGEHEQTDILHLSPAPLYYTTSLETL
jgi:hypothetical protein